MARLNIENHAFGDSRLYVFQMAMDWNRNEAFGALCFLWHSSQRQGIVEATEKQIQLWMGCNDGKLIEALVDSDYIEPICGKTYKIRGNKEQIDGLNAFVAKQRNNGGKGGRPKTQKNPDEPNPNPNEPKASPKNPNSNSNSNSIFEKGNTPQTPRDAGGLSHPLAEIWNSETANTKLPKCAKVNKARRGHADSRLAEYPDLETWRKCARAIAASPFHIGGNNRGWKADFDFFVRPGTILKFIEGGFEKSDGIRSAPVQTFDFDKIFGTTKGGEQ